MRLAHRLPHLLLASLPWVMGACQGSNPPPAPGAEAATQGPEPEATPAAADRRYVALAKPDDPAMLTASATVTAEPGSRHQATAVTRAQVVRAFSRAGEPVKAGQPLVELRSPELLLAAAQSRSHASQAAAYRERLAALAQLQQEGLARRGDTFALRIKIAESEAALEAAEATLMASGIRGKEVAALLRRGTFTLSSPIAGVVSQVNATPGTVYEPFASPPLAEVVGQGAAWVAVETMRKPPSGASLHFESLDGTTVALEPEPRSSVPLPSGGLRIFYEPKEPTSLIGGLKGRVVFEPMAEGAYQVPLEAVGRDGAVEFVRVLKAGGDVRVQVDVLSRSGTSAMIRADALSEEDRVAVPVGEGSEEQP